jgi:hypothetical protein
VFWLDSIGLSFRLSRMDAKGRRGGGSLRRPAGFTGWLRSSLPAT